MKTTPQAQDSLQAVAAGAHAFGAELSQMLGAANYTQAEKDAWATLVPYMSTDELERFANILERNLQGQVTLEIEDSLLLAKAAQMKRDFVLASVRSSAIRELSAIEKELDRLENGGR